MPYKDPEKRKAHDKAYAASHREVIKAQKAARYIVNREVTKARSAARAAAHPEEVKAYKAAWYVANKKEQQARAAVNHAAHPEKAKARSAARYAAHLEEEKARSANYYLAHQEEIKARAAVYSTTHPEVTRTARARRRARKKGLPATLTVEQWEAIKLAYGNRCAYCGKKEGKKRLLTQDHVIPIEKGGGTTSDNIVPACKSCNSRKRAGPPPSIPPTRLMI